MTVIAVTVHHGVREIYRRFVILPYDIVRAIPQRQMTQPEQRNQQIATPLRRRLRKRKAPQRYNY